MLIDDYKFGEVIILGKLYHEDVIVFPHKIITNWHRKEGHSLIIEDIPEIISYHPDKLIIGTGESGVLHVPGDTITAIEKLGIKVITAKTPEACKIFNDYMSNNANIVAALHLTC